MCSDAGAMTGWTRRLAAAAALSGLLACSGLGMCWTRVLPVATAHDCCTSRGDRISRAPQPCTGEASYVKAESVPPSAPTAMPVALLTTSTHSVRPAAFAPSFPVKDPPLVLRI
jgi:hypothetical protein